MKGFLIKYIVVTLLGSIFIILIVPQVVSGKYESLVPPPVSVASINNSRQEGALSPQAPHDPTIEIIGEEEVPTDPKEGTAKKPPLKPVRKPRKRPTHYWGVVKRKNTPSFNSSGKFLRSLQPGTVVDIVESKKTKSGIIKVCNMVYNGKSITNILIQSVNLQLKSGSFKNTSKDDRAKMSRMGKIIFQLAQLKKIEREETLKRNPLAKQYSAVKTKHRAYWAKVMDLQKERDRTTGNEQLKHYDELRRMKGMDITIGLELEKISKKYEAWNSRNPPPPSPKAMELNKELAVVAEQLRKATIKDDG